jgi:hypothetical protein
VPTGARGASSTRPASAAIAARWLSTCSASSSSATSSTTSPPTSSRLVHQRARREAQDFGVFCSRPCTRMRGGSSELDAAIFSGAANAGGQLRLDPISDSLHQLSAQEATLVCG